MAGIGTRRKARLKKCCMSVNWSHVHLRILVWTTDHLDMTRRIAEFRNADGKRFEI